MTDADPSTQTQALIVRPRVLPTTAQFAIEQQMAWKLRNARGFLPGHFMTGDENERAAKILAAIEYARAVGIEPMIALQNTQVIDGKVGASALLIGALLRKAGYAITDDTNDERSVVNVSKNGVSARGEFSMQDAARAKLLKDGSGWQKYPRDMMYARALTQAARRGAQDAVLGMAYTAEELGGIEEEIAGVPVLEGEIVSQEAVQANTGVQPAPSPAASGVPEATGSLPVAAIQPASPAPSEGVSAAEVPQATEIPAAEVPPTPPPAPFNPSALSGASVSRRMGRSVGPAPRRTNVVTVEQGAEKPATASEAPPPATIDAEIVSSQPAPSALTDEPIPAEPVDDGHAVFVESLRTDLRQRAATLARLNAITRNHLVHALKGEEPEEVPPATPSKLSDESLQNLIERDFPGRTLETLGEAELQNRLELIEPFISKRRDVLKEKGITEE